MAYATGAFLQAKVKFLWCLLLGLIVVLPDICGAQLTVKVETAFSTEGGKVNLETDYRSVFSNSILAGVQQNEYSNNVFGNGGPTTVGAEFQVNGNSEIGFAGLSVLKLPSATEGSTILRALEKVSTSSSSPSQQFVAAAGSQIVVTETLHSTNASTQQGTLLYLVQSTGEGQMTAGMMSNLNKECVECKELCYSGKGTFEDIHLERMQTMQSGSAPDKLTAGFQSVDLHIDVSGQYSGAFQVIIAPPK